MDASGSCAGNLATWAPLTALEEEAIAHALRGPAPLHHGAQSWGYRCPSYNGSRARLRRTGSSWYRLTYASGSPGDCTPIVSGAGLTRLICHQTSGNMGLYRKEIALLGYVQKPDGVEERAQEIFAFRTNLDDPTNRSGDDQSELRVVTEREFEILGAAAYSAGDSKALSVEVEVESRMICPSGPPACARKGTDTVTLSLVFPFDGRSFRASPATRRQLDRLRAREPE